MENFKSNPQNLKFYKNIIKYPNKQLDINNLSIFKYYKNYHILLAYYFNFINNVNKSTIYIYDFNENKIIKEYNNIFEIKLLNHYLYKFNNYLLFINSKNHLLIINFDLDKYEIQIDLNENNLKKNEEFDDIYYGCLFFDDSFQYIFISNSSDDYIKLWDLKNKKLLNSKFCKCDKGINFMNTFNDYQNEKKFIITAGYQNVNSYYLDTGELFKSYYKQSDKFLKFPIVYNHFIIETIQNRYIIFIASEESVRLFDFYESLFLKEFILDRNNRFDKLILWNEKYLICGEKYAFNNLYLFNLENNKCNIIFKNKVNIGSLLKYKLPNINECLIIGDENGIKIYKSIKFNIFNYFKYFIFILIIIFSIYLNNYYYKI